MTPRTPDPAAAAATPAEPGSHFLPGDSERGDAGDADVDGDGGCTSPPCSSHVPGGAAERAGRGAAESQSRRPRREQLTSGTHALVENDD